MINFFKKIWYLISYLGIDEKSNLISDELKIRVFFNQSLFFGFFTLLATLFTTIDFIGNYAYLNLVTCFAILIALIVHVKGNFNLAKRIVVYCLFGVGLFLTALSGGDFLYHIGIITVVTFALVIFNTKKESIELLLFFMLAVFGYAIGELNLFNAPDFSAYPATQSNRLLNLIGYTAVSLIFLNFIRRLNIQYEEELSLSLQAKELLMEEVLLKTNALEVKSNGLEEEVSKRTAELQSQKKILESKNAEKEMLLKEIHHRVKNNLQIIVSLLNLQSRSFSDQHVLEAFAETQNRVISMSLVHERMYQTTDFVAVEFRAYTDLLLDNIGMLFSNQENPINRINEVSPELKVDIETAIPLGLILNEMITNSFKHAFTTNATHKEISIAIKEANQSLTLEYKDNGLGFPPNFNIETSETLGLQLISGLVEQIDGELSYYNQNGAIYEINFPI